MKPGAIRLYRRPDGKVMVFEEEYLDGTYPLPGNKAGVEMEAPPEDWEFLREFETPEDFKFYMQFSSLGRQNGSPDR